jgi:hypothetical protein
MPEIIEGTARRDVQFEWARTHVRPVRSHFSNKSGFFIVRADHDCFWVNGWVGIGNQNYFIRAVWYSTIWAVFVTLCGLAVWSRLAKDRNTQLIFWFYEIIMAILGTFTAGQMVYQPRNACANVTIIEQVTGAWDEFPNVYEKGCVSNWEEICGTRKFWPCWLLPVPIPRVIDGFGYSAYGGVDQGIL